MRIAIGEFIHEANTFSPTPTTLEHFKADHLVEGTDILEALNGTNSEIGGFLERVLPLKLDVVPLVAAHALSAGPLTGEAYLYIQDRILERLAQAGPLDGVFLALHGATVAEVDGGDDVTGLLLRRVRQAVGPNTPVIATLDLHANVTRQMVEQGTALIAYQTWPHVDMARRGQEAASLLLATIMGQVKPVTALAKLRMILQVENGQTTSGPMADLVGQIRHWRQEGLCLSGSVYLVHPWLDIPGLGCAVTIITDDNRSQAQTLANELAATMWRKRCDFEVTLTPIDAAIDRALQATGRPVIFADSADSTGSGAPGDSTAILSRLLEREISCKVILPIVDQEAVRLAFQAGQGAAINLAVGGKLDPINGHPVSLAAEVEWLGQARFQFKGPVFTGQETNMGPVAVLRVRDIHIVVSERALWTIDPEMYRAVGLEPTEAQIVVVKSPNLFRASYEPIAHDIITVDTPGLASANLKSLPYQRLSRPLYPFDEEGMGLYQ